MTRIVKERTGHMSLRRRSGEQPDGEWHCRFNPSSQESFLRAAQYVGCSKTESHRLWRTLQKSD
jgi:hypothetical protein